MVKISVIVPVYNTEKYLRECIDSILSQTFSDFELILVNDGSTDNSRKICETYAQKDDRIIVIHQRNSGVSTARNAGIKASSGAFVTFIDSDDYIRPEMLQKLYEQTEQTDADCIIAGLVFAYEKNIHNKCYPLHESLVIFSDSLNAQYKFLASNFVFCAVYAKLYKKRILTENSIAFEPDFSILEDGMFVADYFAFCSSIKCIPECLYFYRQFTEESLMKRFNKNADEAFARFFYKEEKLRNLLDEENLRDYYHNKMCGLWSFICQIYTRSNLSFAECKQLLRKYIGTEAIKIITKNILTNSLATGKMKLLAWLIYNDQVTLLHGSLYYHFRIAKRVGR